MADAHALAGVRRKPSHNLQGAKVNKLKDLRERLANAEKMLKRVATEYEAKGYGQSEVDRVLLKASGVRLALSYVDEALRHD